MNTGLPFTSGLLTINQLVLKLQQCKVIVWKRMYLPCSGVSRVRVCKKKTRFPYVVFKKIYVNLFFRYWGKCYYPKCWRDCDYLCLVLQFPQALQSYKIAGTVWILIGPNESAKKFFFFWKNIIYVIHYFQLILYHILLTHVLNKMLECLT